MMSHASSSATTGRGCPAAEAFRRCFVTWVSALRHSGAVLDGTYSVQGAAAAAGRGPHPAFIVAEDHVQDPMQAVFDGPNGRGPSGQLSQRVNSVT